MQELSVRVADKRREAQDVVSLELVDAQGAPLPAFTAGAHIDVHLPGGLIRQYSLLNDSAERTRYRIGVLREAASRGGSLVVHDRIEVGDVLRISEPRNRFALQAAPRSLLLAGGIGVTPILCMARQLHAAGADFEFHYSCRTRARAAFLDDIGGSALAARTRLHFDDEPDTALDAPALLASAGADTHVYVCGPAGFIDHVVALARAAGFEDSRIHFERFAASEPVAPVQGDQAFQVRLASTGEVFDIPADEPVTKALDRHGVFIPVSCEEGICGTCLTGVVEGDPDHRDSYLTDEEHAANDQFTPCCSRSKTPMLVIDL
ncbi:PDR/VanB family oxidoreductase [Castellaniella sp. S9]|uniref:PDR/VanB family oxidoreductase n=1 Tax=Castellaniella sp. S9 TaxID=2993652 RepID=UPI0022B4856D|nr:PDR/VanB family oxidoreductase [Castellaniella sp. S9]